MKKLQQKGTVMVLQSDNLSKKFSFESPDIICPKQQQIQVKGKKIKMPLQPYSVNVIRVKMS